MPIKRRIYMIDDRVLFADGSTETSQKVNLFAYQSA
ncbi:MAG: hypothetical protein MAG431_02472 [Chloroflexi bacterium]|nr:hypothetical protein [Chloroflexota bacterium]